MLERRAEARRDPDWARVAALDPTTRYVIARGTTHLVHRGTPEQIAYLNAAHPTIGALPESQLTLLGWFEGYRVVLAELPEDTSLTVPGTEYQELRPLLSALSQGEAEILGLARALGIWRSRHRHCGVCGAPTEPRNAGHVLRCTNDACQAEFFPRIDPAIIVLVTDEDRALLGRQPGWPRGRYSALAGFVEPGGNRHTRSRGRDRHASHLGTVPGFTGVAVSRLDHAGLSCRRQTRTSASGWRAGGRALVRTGADSV